MRFMRANFPSTPSSTSTKIATRIPATSQPCKNIQATKNPTTPVATVTWFGVTRVGANRRTRKFSNGGSK